MVENEKPASKECFKCGVVKALSEFYRHPQMGDGHLNKCKECAKTDVRENRRERVDYYRAYDRVRGNRQPEGYQQSYKIAFPKKALARNAVGYATKNGKIKKPNTCESCGSGGAIHGHHDDYDHPLDVRWLCAACHRQWHMANGPGRNGGD